MINGGSINSFTINGAPGVTGSSNESFFENITSSSLLSVIFDNILLEDLKGVDFLTGGLNLFIDSQIENLSVSKVLQAIRVISFIDSLNVSSSLLTSMVNGIGEGITANSALSSTATVNNILQANISLDDVVKIILQGNILDNLQINQTESVYTTFLNSIQDILETNDSLGSILTALNSLALTLTVADSVLHGFFLGVTENLQVNQSSSELLILLSNIIDNLTVALTSSDTILLLSVLSDDVALNDIHGCNLTTLSSILENLEMVVLGEPNDIYSGWVLSPETFAVWNYDNYNFNSIATLSGKTFLANSTGLFSMEGSLDNTAFIKSKLKTAGIDFGTTNLKQVPDMYIGMALTGDLVVKVTTDERVTISYKLKVPSVVSEVQTVKLGKGLRGSVWQFELIDQGATQMDISSIEWIPVVFGRKRR